jgi:hypothetical protein
MMGENVQPSLATLDVHLNWMLVASGETVTLEHFSQHRLVDCAQGWSNLDHSLSSTILFPRLLSIDVRASYQLYTRDELRQLLHPVIESRLPVEIRECLQRTDVCAGGRTLKIVFVNKEPF